MSATMPTSPCEEWLGTSDDLWDTWVLAEMATEAALHLWRTAAIAEREAAHHDYYMAILAEQHAAEQLRRARTTTSSSFVLDRKAHRAG